MRCHAGSSDGGVFSRETFRVPPRNASAMGATARDLSGVFCLPAGVALPRLFSETVSKIVPKQTGAVAGERARFQLASYDLPKPYGGGADAGGRLVLRADLRADAINEARLFR